LQARQNRSCNLLTDQLVTTLQPGLPDSIAIDRRNVAGASGTARVERCLNDAARCRMIVFRTNAV
jgi:hypothetical protein